MPRLTDVQSLPSLTAGFIFGYVLSDNDLESALTFHDTRHYFNHSDSRPSPGPEIEEKSLLLTDGPRPTPLFLDWELASLNDRVADAIMELLRPPTDPFSSVLETVASKGAEGETIWRVAPRVVRILQSFAALATTFLPDFLAGVIEAEVAVFHQWGAAPKIYFTYTEPDGVIFGGSAGRAIIELGRGTARWVAIAMQIALHVVSASAELSNSNAGENTFSGYVLFIDEPEAHLHPAAVASVIRWCQRLVSAGFNIVAASHSEQFLRVPGEITYVHVARDATNGRTRARTLLSSATPLLQELATEVGLHPSVALSLYRAILYVEGPLDYAVLDEYAGPELETAGIVVVPIHGTRNMEGLIDGELAPRLGIKSGILTDATNPQTMASRSNRKRSREEIWVTRLAKRFEDRGMAPPESFGVAEADLLFALPAEGIRQCFPDTAAGFHSWEQMVDDCRKSLGKSPSDSVDWKSYAKEHYGLPLTTPEGVREVVRQLDLAGIALPSIRNVVDQIVAWATVEKAN